MFSIKKLTAPVAFILSFFLAMTSLQAQESQTREALQGLSPDEVAVVRKVENYLNSLRTVSSRFIQVSDGGGPAEGQFYLQRPGKFRFDYDDPVPITLVTTRFSLLYFDRELREATYIPLSSTPLWFLIREKVELYDGISITSAVETKGSIALTLKIDDDDLGSQMTLIFANNPLSLVKWSVVDEQGITTQVSLIDPVYDNPIAPEHFSTKDLNLPRPGRNRVDD